MRKLITGLFILIPLTIFAKNQKKSDLDTLDFNQKTATAGWLYNYDVVAWHTSDIVVTENEKELQRLGAEWFCFQSEDKNWHAVYGKYENDRMNVVFHYLVDTTMNISKCYDTIDTTFLNLHAQALRTANTQSAKIKNTVPITFNQYIKQNDDKTFTVWIFPAFQSDGRVVYGGEFIYEIDTTGTRILADNSYYQGAFRTFQVGETQEIRLDYTDLKKPTLGSVFFIWYYKQYFAHIILHNKNSFTTAVKENEEEYSWVHVFIERKKRSRDLDK